MLFENRPVILRTLDIGGDKDIPTINMPEEANPFLGMRGIRLCPFLILSCSSLNYAQPCGPVSGNNLKLMFPHGVL